VYQLGSSEYHELVNNWDVGDNYNPNIPKWAGANYPRTFMYDDAHANVLKEALPFQTDRISKGIGRKK
jgi:hypothetical protein